MNYTTTIFLVNKRARAIAVSYGEKAGEQHYTFKTLDPAIAVGDLVVIPTNTRHLFTVGKVEAVDVDVDFDGDIQFKWLAGKVDTLAYSATLEAENEVNKTIRSGELRKKRDDLRGALIADASALNGLAIVDMTADAPPVAPPPRSTYRAAPAGKEEPQF